MRITVIGRRREVNPWQKARNFQILLTLVPVKAPVRWYWQARLAVQTLVQTYFISR